jgi:gamma-glutamyltranspeptidase / glutathione hydrolase
MPLRDDTLGLEHYPYTSRRLPVMARRGMVATSEPLAAQAGLAILRAGGNAIDAAIATAAALTVVEPTCNGIGGDAFALIWDGSRLHSLNGSGRSLRAHSRDLFRQQNLDHIPARGWLPVTVPGVPAAWRDMHQRFGHLAFEKVFEPAIEYATEGFPVGPMTAQRWNAAAAIYHANNDGAPELRPWRETYTRDGRAPRAGELWALPDHALTLRELAGTGCESFYCGRLAQQLLAFSDSTGGYLTKADLQSHESVWEDPISARYRGYDVWEVPPSTQGIAALTALNILDGIDLARTPRESAESYHLQIEALKLAQNDAYQYIADPQVTDVPWRARLTAEFARDLRSKIGHTALTLPPTGRPKGGTVYLCCADADGLMVSFIQSNYSGWLLGFGSGVVVPSTGIALHSRACGFTLNEGHPNVIAPSKRPFHTLAPSFLTHEGRAVGPFGIMGGPMQPQGHVQFVVNQIDYGMNPQTALDAPRFQWINGDRVEVELGVPSDVMQGLVARGHDLAPCVDFSAIPPRLGGAGLGSGGLTTSGDFGKAQIIRRLDNGAYVAGSDWRADGCAVGY